MKICLVSVESVDSPQKRWQGCRIILILIYQRWCQWHKGNIVNRGNKNAGFSLQFPRHSPYVRYSSECIRVVLVTSLSLCILCRAMMQRARPMKLYKVRTLALHLSGMLLQKRTISRYVLASLQWPAMAPWNEAEAKPRRFPHYCRPSYKLLWLAQRPTPLQYGRVPL